MKQGFQLTPHEKLVERAYLVGVSLPDSSMAKEGEHLDELRQLATTAGAVVAGQTIQGRTRIDGATYIGQGKAAAIKRECEALDVNLIIFDSDLSPAQARNLEKIFEINVIDRTELILDIFARHAKTQQAKTQVELAQLNYQLPRLRKLWDHLSRQAGGIGTRGPGETQLEVDRRRVRERLGRLRRQLANFDRRRDILRKSREPLPVAALVGYTNAGKSTLMNTLTDASTLAENQLFATLDTLTRKMNGRNGNSIMLVDTVGFIRKLPHHLVESFKATLGDIAAADVCLHVIDAAHPAFQEQMEVTDSTLRSIDKDIGERTIYVFNKIDALDEDELKGLRLRYPDALFISAKDDVGLEDLHHRIESTLFGKEISVEVRIEPVDGRAIARVKSLLHNHETSLENGHCLLTGMIESRFMEELDRVEGADVRYLI